MTRSRAMSSPKGNEMNYNMYPQNIAPKTEDADGTQQQHFGGQGYGNPSFVVGTPLQLHQQLTPQHQHQLLAHQQQQQQQAAQQAQMQQHYNTRQQHIMQQQMFAAQQVTQQGQYIQQHPNAHHGIIHHQGLHQEIQQHHIHPALQGHISTHTPSHSQSPQPQMVYQMTVNQRSPRSESQDAPPAKRKCVSSACIPCRRRKSKCDGGTPSCSTCSAVYDTPCEYDYEGDHRRKGAYKRDLEVLQARTECWKKIIDIQVGKMIPNRCRMELSHLLGRAPDVEIAADAATKQAGGPRVHEGPLPISLSNYSEKVIPTENPCRFKLLADGELLFCGFSNPKFFVPIGPAARPAFGIGPDESWSRITTISLSRQRHYIKMFLTWIHPNYTLINRKSFEKSIESGQGRYCNKLLYSVVCSLGAMISDDESLQGDAIVHSNDFWKDALFWFEEEGSAVTVINVIALGLMALRCTHVADQAGCSRYLALAWEKSKALGLQTCLNPRESELTDLEYRRNRQVCFWGLGTIDTQAALFNGTAPHSMRFADQIKYNKDDDEQWHPYPHAFSQTEQTVPARTHYIASKRDEIVVLLNEVLEEQYNHGISSNYFVTRVFDTAFYWGDYVKTTPLCPNDDSVPAVLDAHLMHCIVMIVTLFPFSRHDVPGLQVPPHETVNHTLNSILVLVQQYLAKANGNHRRLGPLVTSALYHVALVTLTTIGDKQSRAFLRYALYHLHRIAEHQIFASQTLQSLNYAAVDVNHEFEPQTLELLASYQPRDFAGVQVLQTERCQREGITLIPLPDEESVQNRVIEAHQYQEQAGLQVEQQQQKNGAGPFLKAEPISPPNKILSLNPEDGAVAIPSYENSSLGQTQVTTHYQSAAEFQAQAQAATAAQQAARQAQQNIQPFDPDSNNLFEGDWAMNIGLNSEDAPSIDEPDHDQEKPDANSISCSSSTETIQNSPQTPCATQDTNDADGDADAEGEGDAQAEASYDALFNETIGHEFVQ